MTKQQPKTKSSIERPPLQEDPESKVGILPDVQDLPSPLSADPNHVFDTSSVVANEGDSHDCRPSPTLPTEVAKDKRPWEGGSRMSHRTPEVEAIKRENLRELLERDYQMKFNQNNLAICPFHDDHEPSFSIFKGGDGFWRWKCLGCEKGGDYFDFKALKEGRPLDDILKGVSSGSGASVKHPRRKPIATYVYTDELGNPLYRKLKYDSEHYDTQRYENGKWISRLNGTKRVLYRLPELAQASQIFLLEGEKDCETVKDLGLVATTMGSIYQWKAEYATWFAGKDVAICFDVGNEKVADRAARDIASHAKSVKVLSLPGLTEREQDITDWFEQMVGATVEEKRKRLFEIVDQTPLFLAGTPEPDARPSGKSMTFTDFVKKNIPPGDIFMEYWVKRENLTLLGGIHKSGKSALAVNLGLSIASGEDFLGFSVPKPRKVLYVQQEICESDMQKRLQQMSRCLGQRDFSNFMIENTTGCPLKLTKKDGLARLIALLKCDSPDLLILDHLSTFHNKDENSAEEMSPVMDVIFELKYQFKIAVLLIHHFGKPSLNPRPGTLQFRGSTIIADRADSLIMLNRMKPNGAQLSDPSDFPRRISFRLRSDPDPCDIAVKLDPVTMWFQIAGQASLQQRKLPAEAIVDAIKAHGGKIKQTELEELLKGRAARGTILRAIEEAVAAGQLDSEKLPERGGPVLLTLKGGLS